MNDEEFSIGQDEKGNDVVVYLPRCCVEGHEDCPHVINKPVREQKKNIAL